MLYSNYQTFRSKYRRALIKRGRSPKTGRIHKGIYLQQFRRAQRLADGIIDPTKRPTERTAIHHVIKEEQRFESLRAIHTPLAILARVWYWNREYLNLHRCTCRGTAYRVGMRFYRDFSQCICFSHVTYRRERWIALRAFVPEDRVSFMLDEVENIARFCAAEGYSEPFDYQPSDIELARIGEYSDANLNTARAENYQGHSCVISQIRARRGQ